MADSDVRVPRAVVVETADASQDGERVVELTTRRTDGGLRLLAVPLTAATPARRRFRWVADAFRPFVAVLLLAVGILLLPASLSSAAKGALFAFSLAVVLWSMTRLTAAWVALVAVVTLIGLGGAEQDALFASLSSDVVWLMIGAFVLGGAVQVTGLAARLTSVVAGEQRSVSQVCWRITALLLPLTFLIPSTSGRAAVVLPLYTDVTRAIDDRRVSRALSLLIPTVILVSTIGTLVGAGSHLIANNLLAEVADQRISFLQWALYGAPFAVVASLLSCAVVLRLYLDPGRRARRVDVARQDLGQLTRPELRTLAITAGMVLFWSTESLHGIEIATVAVVGAVLLTMPGVGVLSWKRAMAAVSWNLVVFVGAALVLGQALIATGAAAWIVDRLFTATGLAEARSTVVILFLIAIVSLTSHVYMTSHAARAAALIPPLLYVGVSLDLSLPAVMFIGTVGMDYCLTFPVSSKALLMFSELGSDTFEPPDLLKLSSVLLVVHVALVVAFYFGYWQWIGLAL